MIGSIKNRHLRRLALFGWTLLFLAAIPFFAVFHVVWEATRFVTIHTSEWWYTFHKYWNQP